MDNGPEIKRALLGYRKKDVESVLEVRERMFERVTEEANRRKADADDLRRDLDKAREEARSAREETESVRGELSSALETVRSELGSLRSELQSARREVAGLDERLRVADATEADLRTRLEQATAAAPDNRELGAVLEATQEAIGRILAGARLSAEEDLSRVRRARQEIQAEIDRARSWQGRIEPLTRGIATGVAVAQAQMSQTAERVGEALRPMSEALTSLSHHLEELAGVADPTTPGEPPDRVDLVSHEQRRSVEEAGLDTGPDSGLDTGRDSGRDSGPDSGREVGVEVGAGQEAPAGAPFHPDPWPDPWR